MTADRFRGESDIFWNMRGTDKSVMGALTNSGISKLATEGRVDERTQKAESTEVYILLKIKLDQLK